MTSFDVPIILLLVGVNAFYVAAEFAAVSVRKSRVAALAEADDASAQLLIPYLEDPRKLDAYVAACQIGITWSSLLLGAYGQAAIAVRIAPSFAQQTWAAQADALLISTGLVLVVLSAIQVVFGELVPKSIALQHPHLVGRLTIRPMVFSLKLYSWFIHVLNGHAWALLKLFKVPIEEGYRHVHSPRELAHLIAESRKAGLIEPQANRRLETALALTNRSVREVMIPIARVYAIPEKTTPSELMRIVTEKPFTRIPVYGDDPHDLVGFVHTREVAKTYLAGRLDSIGRVLHEALPVHEHITLDRVLTFMREYRSHMAFVVDAAGEVLGVVTLDDLLEELFGTIPAEFRGGGVR